MKKLSFGKIITHLVLLAIVVIWVIPTFGLLVSSLRDKDQIALTGWWKALKYNEFNEIIRTEKSNVQVKEGEYYVITGSLFSKSSGKEIKNFGITSKAPSEYKAPLFNLINRSLCRYLMTSCMDE